MPEATTDLPDPLEETPASASSSPDDLLSQMADEAIDKLIADADNGVPSAAQSSAVTPAEYAALAESPGTGAAEKATDIEPAASPDSTPVQVTESLQGELDSLFNQLDDVPGATPSSPTNTNEAAPAPAASLSADLSPDDLDLLDSPSAADAASTDVVPTDTPADATQFAAAPVDRAEHAPSSIAMPPPVDVPADIANDDGHGGAANASADHATAAEAESAMRADVKALLDDAVHEGEPSVGAGLLVKPLQWLNAPFANMSDEARDTIGQIAVVTMINALAVILYVIIFRR